jgi:RNA polymerase sigma factor (sigma-70 family)
VSPMHDARDAEDNRLLAAGDFALLVEGYYGLIVDRCRARTRSEADALDVASAVVVRLLGELKGGKRYRVAFRVVVNKVIGWKLSEHYGRPPVEEVELGEEVAGGDDVYERLVAELDLLAALDGLPPREREVTLLRFRTGLDADQIAARLGISRNNVDQAWHRAKRKLRLTLEPA